MSRDPGRHQSGTIHCDEYAEQEQIPLGSTTRFTDILYFIYFSSYFVVYQTRQRNALQYETIDKECHVTRQEGSCISYPTVCTHEYYRFDLNLASLDWSIMTYMRLNTSAKSSI